MNNINIIKAIPNYIDVKKRVVGYARVSTNNLLQDTSYNLQIEELEKDIKSNANYRFLVYLKIKILVLLSSSEKSLKR